MTSASRLLESGRTAVTDARPSARAAPATVAPAGLRCRVLIAAIIVAQAAWWAFLGYAAYRVVW